MTSFPAAKLSSTRGPWALIGSDVEAVWIPARVYVGFLSKEGVVRLRKWEHLC